MDMYLFKFVLAHILTVRDASFSHWREKVGSLYSWNRAVVHPGHHSALSWLPSVIHAIQPAGEKKAKVKKKKQKNICLGCGAILIYFAVQHWEEKWVIASALFAISLFFPSLLFILVVRRWASCDFPQPVIPLCSLKPSLYRCKRVFDMN